METNPNPQGKGLVTVFSSLAESQAKVPVVSKNIEQVSNELFTSLFVLHSQFQFKPVVGKSYWLYHRKHQFQLSLVSPQEWGGNQLGQFVGECILQKDITWVLNLDEQALHDYDLMSVIKRKRHKFKQALNSAQNVDKVLPFYLERLPFYQRVFASALACSLRDSMTKSAINGLSYMQAKKVAELQQLS